MLIGMSGKRDALHHKRKKEKHKKSGTDKKDHNSAEAAVPQRLDIVLKCDTSGCAEALVSAIRSLSLPEVEIHIIHTGIGAVNKSDVFLAATGSRLIVGFNVGLMPHMDQAASDQGVEIRLYEIIYKLLDDLESIAKSLTPGKSSEEIIGSAKVIALFTSSRKGVILGCEVLAGKLALGNSFRVLGAMGQIYTGKIESLHIAKDAVREAVKGQQVGLKIRDFNKARVGDLVESFQATAERNIRPWQSQGKIYYP